MGTRGPIPKRAAQRRRRNIVPTETVIVPKSTKLFGPPISASPDMHPLAANWYGGLRRSGQAEFYEASDWATAAIWAELISHALNSGKPSAVLIAAWSSEATNLLTTEGARRRVRLELERAKGPDAERQRASATVLDLRRRLASG